MLYTTKRSKRTSTLIILINLSGEAVCSKECKEANLGQLESKRAAAAALVSPAQEFSHVLVAEESSGVAEVVITAEAIVEADLVPEMSPNLSMNSSLSVSELAQRIQSLETESEVEKCESLHFVSEP